MTLSFDLHIIRYIPNSTNAYPNIGDNQKYALKIRHDDHPESISLKSALHKLGSPKQGA